MVKERCDDLQDKTAKIVARSQDWPTAEEFKEAFMNQPSLAEIQRRCRVAGTLPNGLRGSFRLTSIKSVS